MDDSNVKVLVNHEEQYSLWPTFLDVPAGWTDTGVSGTKEACLSYVKEVWTDMRPLSLRRRMAESTATQT
jgi:MbtH protein